MDFKNKKLIIFDFDGTLIDSIPDLTLAINKMLTHYGFTPITIEEVTPFVGNGAKLLVERALKHNQPNKELDENFVKDALTVYFSAYKEDICNKTYLYSGVAETLSYLEYKGYKMTICTNKPVSFIEPILTKLSIKQFFSYWIGEDSLAYKKPSPEPLIHLANKMNITLEQSIMIGDSKNDIFAAQNAGMDSIGLSYGYNYNVNISSFNPTKVVDDFSELQKLF